MKIFFSALGNVSMGEMKGARPPGPRKNDFFHLLLPPFTYFFYWMRPDEACFVCYGVLFNFKLISRDLI